MNLFLLTGFQQKHPCRITTQVMDFLFLKKYTYAELRHRYRKDKTEWLRIYFYLQSCRLAYPVDRFARKTRWSRQLYLWIWRIFLRWWAKHHKIVFRVQSICRYGVCPMCWRPGTFCRTRNQTLWAYGSAYNRGSGGYTGWNPTNIKYHTRPLLGRSDMGFRVGWYNRSNYDRHAFWGRTIITE